MDTLPSGHIVVRNDDRPVWPEGGGWRMVEELRIGSVEGGRPDAFGAIEAFDVDGAGRIWVVDGQVKQLVVFDASGEHVRTTGRRGGGPGEFMMPVDVDVAPDGRVWVVDIGNARITVFDTAGEYVDGRQIPTRFRMTPWPHGGFDDHGRFYAPVGATPSDWEQVAITLVRHDSALVPRDTLERPLDPTPPEVFEYGRWIVPVPLQGTLSWQRSRDGTVWVLVTDEYRLFQLTWSGDTLRTITRASSPLSVTEADLEQVRSAWAREIEREGTLPRWWSRIPNTKAPVTGFFFEDDEGNHWVELEPEAATDTVQVFDVFDPEGRYLGPVLMPFVLRSRPSPVIRAGFLYGITLDELDVPYIVKARLIRRATS